MTDQELQRIREIENAAGVLLGLTLAYECVSKLRLWQNPMTALQKLIDEKSVEFGIKASEPTKAK